MKTPNIVNMKFGSHLYGLDTPNSDIDYKGIYLPELPELLLGSYPQTIKSSTAGAHVKNQAGDIDREVISLPKFIKHAVQGETFAIDMLHCENPISSSDIWEDLVANRTKFYSKNMKAYVGYVRKQAAKYGIKGSRLASIRQSIESLMYAKNKFNTSTPIQVAYDNNLLHIDEYAKWLTHSRSNHPQDFYEVNGKMYQSTNSIGYVLTQLSNVYDTYGERAKAAERNDGVDWKAVSHALRAGYQARAIYVDGDFNYPLNETDFILSVKQGKLDFKTEVSPVLESLVDEVNILADSSKLPDKVNSEYWNQWLLDQYSNSFNLNL